MVIFYFLLDIASDMPKFDHKPTEVIDPHSLNGQPLQIGVLIDDVEKLLCLYFEEGAEVTASSMIISNL